MKIKLILLILLLGYNPHSNAEECGSLENHFGPYDYRTNKNYLPVVEDNHFSSVTYAMALSAGSSEKYSKEFKFTGQNAGKTKHTSIAGDLDYTLSAFPNHPRALYAVSEYQRIMQRNYKNPSLWRPKYRTADCYFKRAIRFAPTDPMVYMVYGLYFHKRKEYEKALLQYRKSEKMNADNIDLLYYLGLVNYELGNFDEAQKYADKVYQRKYPLEGLKDELKKHNAMNKK